MDRFVGVSGISRPEEVDDLRSLAPGRCIGIEAFATRASILNLNEPMPEYVPRRSDLPEIFLPGNSVCNILRYVVTEPRALSGQLSVALGRADSDCHVVRIDGAFPAPSVLQELKAKYPKTDRCISVDVGQWAEIGGTAAAFAQRLAVDYGILVSAVALEVLQKSGAPVSPFLIGEYLQELDRELPHAMPIISGWWSPQVLQLATDLRFAFSRVSWVLRFASGVGSSDVRKYLTKMPY